MYLCIPINDSMLEVKIWIALDNEKYVKEEEFKKESRRERS